MTRIARTLAAAAGLAATLTATAALAWWQPDWAFRKQVTVDTSAAGAALPQVDGRVPVLLRLHSGNFLFDDARDDGGDLRIVLADDATVLRHHVESFDKLLGVGLVWVDLDALPANGAADLWIYSGNPEAPDTGDRAGTFDADYALVYHFDGAADQPPRDATAYGNDAEITPVGISPAGAIGPAARFDGSHPLLLPVSPSLNGTLALGFTFSAWVRPDALAPDTLLYARRNAGDGLLIGLDSGVPFVEVVAGGMPQRALATQPLATGQWAQLAVTADPQQVLLYVNGTQAAALAVAVPDMETAAVIGADVAAGSTYAGFSGELDELRLSRTARSAAVLLADFAATTPDSRLLAFGADEEQSHGGFGYFGVIVESVTVDAWVVIGLCLILGVVSMVVIVRKSRYVGSTHDANEAFLVRYRALGNRLTALAADPRIDEAARDELGRSSLYRLYLAGVAEVEGRMEGGAHSLSAESIEAIRAVIDANLVRENQRLSKGLVVLTLSISGGPFLGLLGTVVGVMITFAAIAAAGDVNVNAIAPGISAALLATVAGLGVAIPALFGYNYLTTRNRDVTANMQVFVDEFVTRLAELHRAPVPHHSLV